MNYHQAFQEKADPNFGDFPMDFIADGGTDPATGKPKGYTGTGAVATQEERAGYAGRSDHDYQTVQQTNAMNEGHDPGSQTAPYGQLTPDAGSPDGNARGKIVTQSRGFSNQQLRDDFTMGVIASVSSPTLENSRVYVETPTTKIAGTVLAVGDQEFAVIWDDKTASVERKADYELVVKN